jgi:hypothetical protein
MLVLLALALAACGGESSSETPPAELPPPSAHITTNEETVLSGGTFFVVVSGEPIESLVTTVEFSCTNDVELNIENNSINVLDVDITVPEVSEFSNSVCTATMTDSIGRTARSTLDITILPKTEIGQVVGIFDPPLKLVLPNYNLLGASDSTGSHVVAITESPNLDGRFEIKAIAGNSILPRKYYRDDIVTVEGDYASIDFVQSPSLSTHGLASSSLSIASEKENTIYWLSQEANSKEFKIRGTIEVERPCFIAQTDTLFANDLIVGQFDEGLTLFDISTENNGTTAFNTTRIQNIGIGRSFCHIYRGIIPDSIVKEYTGQEYHQDLKQNFNFPLTAIDYNSLELVYYADTNQDNMLEELGSVPIETNSIKDLKIVKVISRGGPSQAPNYLILLLSDGNHDGEHRIVQLNYDGETQEFNQQILSEWNVGLPVAMLQGPAGGSTKGGLSRPDLVVILSTVEQSLFFDNLLPYPGTGTNPPVYGEPTLFNVSIGAGSAVAALNPNISKLDTMDQGFLVSYPQTGEVIYFTLDNE